MSLRAFGKFADREIYVPKEINCNTANTQIFLLCKLLFISVSNKEGARIFVFLGLSLANGTHKIVIINEKVPAHIKARLQLSKREPLSKPMLLPDAKAVV